MRNALRFSPAAFILLLTLPAAANGRFPASNQLVFSSTDKNLMVLRTSYGILPSHDNGATWGFICEDSLALSPVAPQDPSIGLTQNNSLIAGVPSGLNVSPDVGCNWNCVKDNGLGGQTIADIAVRPDTPSSAVAITATNLPSDAATAPVLSQVYQTTDNGVSWTTLGMPIDPRVTVTTIDVTKTDPNRIYVTGTRGYGAARSASLFVSADDGMTWVEHQLPAAQYDWMTEDTIYIGAVDPTDADRVYLRSSGLPTGGRSRLTVFKGAPGGTPTFTTAHIFDVGPATSGEITGELLGLAVSSDGSKIYLGTKEDGLWEASTTDLSFTKKSSIVVQCLVTRGDELWACSAPVSGFVAGVSTDDGASFTAKLPLIGDLTGPIACAPTASGAACGATQNASQCGPPFAAFCALYGCGAPEGGTGTGADGPAKPSSMCNVSLVGVFGCGGGAAVAGAVAVLGVAIRRRRKSR